MCQKRIGVVGAVSFIIHVHVVEKLDGVIGKKIISNLMPKYVISFNTEDK